MTARDGKDGPESLLGSGVAATVASFAGPVVKSQRPGRKKGPKPRKPPRPATRLPDEPPEPEGRSWELTPELSKKIVDLCRCGTPPAYAAAAYGVASSTWYHWQLLAKMAIEKWGRDAAVMTDRYGPMIRLQEDVFRARGELVGELSLLVYGVTQRAAGVRVPVAVLGADGKPMTDKDGNVLLAPAPPVGDVRPARGLLADLAPEVYAPRRFVVDDDAPAALPPPAPGMGEPPPIRVFMPEEQPLLGAGPASGRVVPIRGAVVIEDDGGDFEGEIVLGEGKAVG